MPIPEGSASIREYLKQLVMFFFTPSRSRAVYAAVRTGRMLTVKGTMNADGKLKTFFALPNTPLSAFAAGYPKSSPERKNGPTLSPFCKSPMMMTSSMTFTTLMTDAPRDTGIAMRKSSFTICRSERTSRCRG